jgi:DNA helicase INO80
MGREKECRQGTKGNLRTIHRQHKQANHTTELPPISTALYSRDTSRYYDPTSDNGDRGLGRETARYDNHYPPQV